MPAEKSPSEIKPRIAMIAMGVLGSGLQDQGVPAITEMIHHVSKQFDIVYYSLQPVNERKISLAIKTKQVISWRIPGRLKYLFLMIRFIADHLVNPYQLVYSIAVFPTGRRAVMLGKIFKLPVAVHLLALEAAALSDIQYGSLTSPSMAKITRWVCREADAIIALSEYQSEIARKSLPTRRDFTVIPLSIDCKKFPYKERTISYPVKFIHVAYYHPVKDQITLFRAFSQIATKVDCELTVIGEGFDDLRVHALLKELDISAKVVFLGQIKNDDLAVQFSDVHIMLHSSRFESQCVVALEAMASGIPVCSTRVGILADLGDDFAVLVPVGDADRLAQKTLALIEDKQRYQEIRDRAYEWVSSHDSSWSGNQYATLFKRLVKRKQKSGN